MDRRPIEIEDLLRMGFPHTPALSPDGRRVVCALARLDHEGNEWRSQLWMIPTAGGAPVPFTADEARDTQPLWSPDGRWVAFLSTRGGKRRGRRRAVMQVWVIPADGGEARQLTFFAPGASQPAWSPDGRTLALVTRGTLEGREPDEGDKEDEVIVREITRGKYKFDGMGFLEGYAHIWREVEPAQRPGLLADVGLGPIDVLLVPLERQIAEKLHAYTRPYDDGSTRVKDLVDFMVIRLFERVEVDLLRHAIAQTFTRRGTHEVPKHLPPPPADWAVAYRGEAEAVGLTTDLGEAHKLAAEWLDPVLHSSARGTWDPEQRAWSGKAGDKT